MKAPELLKSFNDLLESFETRRGYIDKAKTQAKKFKPEVIEKVAPVMSSESMTSV